MLWLFSLFASPHSNKYYFLLFSAFCLGFSLPVSIVLLNVSYGLALLALLISHKFNSLKLLCKQPLFYLALIMFLCMAVTFYVYPDPDGVRVIILKRYRKLLYLLPLALFFLQDKRLALSTLLGFMVANSIVLITSILAWAHIANPFGLNQTNPTVFHLHLTQNFFMAISSIVWLSLIFSQRGAVRLISGLFFILTITNTLFMVQGRTGYIALAIGIVVWTCFTLPTRQRYLILTVGAIAAILIAGTPNKAKEGLRLGIKQIDQCITALDPETSDPSSCDTSMGLRTEFAYRAIEAIKVSPWLGNGVGSFNYHSIYSNDHHVNAHNEYLMQLVQTGIIGFILFITWIGCAYRTIVLQLTGQQKVVALAVLTMYLGCSFFNSFILDTYEGQCLMLFIAYLLASQVSTIKPTVASGHAKKYA